MIVDQIALCLKIEDFKICQLIDSSIFTCNTQGRLCLNVGRDWSNHIKFLYIIFFFIFSHTYFFLKCIDLVKFIFNIVLKITTLVT